MSLHNLTRSGPALILGLFLAFMIFAVPRTAAAAAVDVCDEQGDFYTSMGSTMTNVADRLTNVHKDYLDNAVTLDTTNYCMQAMINLIHDIRVIAGGTDIWSLTVEVAQSAIIDPIILAACSFVASEIAGVTAILNSMYLNICLPLPQLHLGVRTLPTFHSCIGFGSTVLGQVGLHPMTSAPNSSGTTPNAWNIWGTVNNNFKTYVPSGP